MIHITKNRGCRAPFCCLLFLFFIFYHFYFIRDLGAKKLTWKSDPRLRRVSFLEKKYSTDHQTTRLGKGHPTKWWQSSLRAALQSDDSKLCTRLFNKRTSQLIWFLNERNLIKQIAVEYSKSELKRDNFEKLFLRLIYIYQKFSKKKLPLIHVHHGNQKKKNFFFLSRQN